MFWLLRRWVTWAPAAFVGGLAYGFQRSGDRTVGLRLVEPGVPRSAASYRRRAWTSCSSDSGPDRHGWGIALALLVTAGFFVSTETVLIVSISAVVGTILLLGYAGLWHRDGFDSGGGMRSPVSASRSPCRRHCWRIPCGSSWPALLISAAWCGRPTYPVTSETLLATSGATWDSGVRSVPDSSRKKHPSWAAIGARPLLHPPTWGRGFWLSWRRGPSSGDQTAGSGSSAPSASSPLR